jgi:hypothetical protein
LSIQKTMEEQDGNSKNRHSRSSAHLLLIIAAIIVLSIAAFLILRPNPTGTAPKSNPATAPSSSP